MPICANLRRFAEFCATFCAINQDIRKAPSVGRVSTFGRGMRREDYSERVTANPPSRFLITIGEAISVAGGVSSCRAARAFLNFST